MSKLSEIIKQMEIPNFPFVPDKDFYKSIGISKKRFWQIYKDEAKNVQVIELKKIAQFFKIDIKTLV